MEMDGQQIVMIEFNQGRAYEVFTCKEGRFHSYDIWWCERDNFYYYSESGFGSDPYLQGSGEYWVLPEFISFVKPNPGVTPNLIALPEDLQNDLNEACESDAVYCNRCRDWLPEINLCDHIWYCERCEEYSTPYSRSKYDPDGCKHNRRQAEGE